MGIKRIIIAMFNSALFKKLIECTENIKIKNYERLGFLRACYYRNAFAECGEDLKIYGKPVIYQPHKIHIGNHVTINNGAQISPRGNVYIGDYVTISRGAQITAGGLDTSNWVDGNYQTREHIQGDVFIGGGSWLCVNSIILPGVHITGKGVIVAAGAVVTNDITDDFVIVGGVPARIVKDLKKHSSESSDL